MFRDVKNNIVKMYFFRFFRDFWLIMPMLIPFYTSFNLTNAEILLIQSIFSISQLLFEVPSGYFSDAIGRRLTLIIGAASLPLGLAIYSAGTGFAEFAAAEFVLGFGFAMCSGTESALIYDTLLQTGGERGYQKIEGFAESFTRFGTAAASLLGGLLAYVFLKLPFYCNICTGLVMCVIAVTFVEPQRNKKSGETGSMCGRILFIVLSPLFGHITDIYSIGRGFLMLAVAFILMSLAGMLCTRGDRGMRLI